MHAMLGSHWMDHSTEPASSVGSGHSRHPPAHTLSTDSIPIALCITHYIYNVMISQGIVLQY